jgi:hypothetical protein
MIQSSVVVRNKRGFKKSGKDDPTATWSQARLAQMRQFKEMLRLGRLHVNDIEVLSSPFPPLLLHALVLWDEKHQKVVLGHASKFEVRVRTHPDTGQPCTEVDGGVLGPAMPKTSIKYPEEARGLFGVAMKNVDDVMVGVKAKPFNYTKRHVVGFKAYELAKKAEVWRVKSLGGVWGADGRGYLERYGVDSWEEQVERKLNMTLCSIKELMDHVIAESNAIYAGTQHENTFMIFHDGLSAWWEVEAQAYMTQRGFARRQLCAFDPTNIGTRYRGKLVGDSPEICRGLDSHGFARLVTSMLFHRSLSSLYAPLDARRFKMGTPAEVWSTISRCWDVEPTNASIVQDISKFEFVVDKIIEAEGCVVHDEFLRTGRRGDEWKRAKGGGDCKNKPQAFQRIATLQGRPIHPDAEVAWRMLFNVDGVVNEDNVDRAFDDAAIAEHEAADTSDDDSNLLHIDGVEDIRELLDIDELFD